jgi:hypothetical protein
MANTIISPLVHSPDEFAIVAMPDSEPRQNITAAQNQVKALLGDVVWLTPPNALHSTLMEIICNTKYEGLSRRAHFERWRERYSNAAREVLAQLPPFDITFDELHASVGAIILKAADTTMFNAIRGALLEHMTLHAQTKVPPDITHCSIARYNQEVSLESVCEQLKGIEVDISLNVDHFMLMTDLGPDFHPSVIDTYRLNESSTEAP